MSVREIDRYDVIRRLIRKEMKQRKAAELLRLSVRQVKRLKKRVKRDGAKGLIHGSRGKPGNRRLPKEEQEKIEAMIRTHYPDFSPVFAAEKLRTEHDIDRDPKTIRSVMIRAKLWSPPKVRRKVTMYSWRPRRSSFGELEQFDGSYHAWLEDRFTDAFGNHEICLLAAIDDATGKITHAEFAAHEGVVPVFGFWWRYLETHGKPRDIYLDRFSTYRMNSRIAAEQPDLKTQFERAMREMGVGLITAHTPQAKGRVERLFGTLQDRLVKEMRLANICTVEAANVFLRDVFLSKFNARFSVVPREAHDLHRIVSKKERTSFDAVFSHQEMRTIRNDSTIAYANAWYQIRSTPGLAPRPKERVIVEARLDGTRAFRLRGKYLQTDILPARPQRVMPPVRVASAHPWSRAPRKPAADHPWRRQRFTDIHVHSQL